MILNESNEENQQTRGGVKRGGKCSHSSQPDGSGDYGRLWGLCEISIRNDLSFTLTCHATSGDCVRFWRVISKKFPQYGP